MEICNGDYGKHVQDLVEAIESGKNNAWRASSNVTGPHSQEEVIALNVTASFQALRQRTPLKTQPLAHGPKGSSEYATNFWRQMHILLKKNAIVLSRDKVSKLSFPLSPLRSKR